MPGNERRHGGRLAVVTALLVCLALLSGRATAWAPPYPILATSGPASLGLFIAWYEDKSNSLTLDAVRRLPAEAFQVSDQDSLNFGYRDSTLWFRVALQNTLPIDTPLLLEIPHPSLRLVEFFQPTATGYESVSASDGSALAAGSITHPGLIFPVTVPGAQTSVYWFRVQSDLALDFSLRTDAPHALGVQNGQGLVLTGLLLGSLLTMVALIAVTWRVTRSNTYGWYLLTLVSVVAFLLSREGYIDVLAQHGFGLKPQIETAAAILATVAGLQFARIFLDTAQRTPRLDPWLGYLLITGLCCLVAIPWVEPRQLGPMYTTFAALVMPATLYAALRARRAGATDVPAYIGARLLSAIAGSVVVFGDWGLLASRPLPTVHLLIIGAMGESALIAWILFVRERRARARDYTQRLRTAIASAEQLARTDLLDRFSHDARTPLNGMLGMAELLGDSALTPRQREYVLSIRSSGENLLTLLNDTLDWSRLDAGQLEVHHVDFDLPQLLADSLETVQLRAEEKHIELVVDIDPSAPVHVNGDPARLRQVLCNLLGNAVRATNRGEVQVQVMPGSKPDMLRIEVRDTGVGIPREQLAGLFERATDQTGRQHGLGLFIARQLVERMGGQIGVQSEERRGSIFWIQLPLPAVAAGDEPPPADTGLLEGKRLLAVDDNATMRRVIETQAAQWGMQVTTADNGQEALAMARSQANLGTPFDAVIVDHNMPGMSGLQLAARIKEDPLIRNDALIIMLTGLSIAPTETMARNVGIRRVLTKPVAGRALRVVLAEEFARRENFEPEDGSTPLPAKMRVLVVEDNQMSQKVIRGMLAKLGVRSELAGNGQEAIEAIQQHRYDLVLMDCEMPVVNGYEATRRIRAWESDGGRRHTPIIALSAHILQEIKDRCRQAGMDAHMAKPVDLNELREVLRVYSED